MMLLLSSRFALLISGGHERAVYVETHEHVLVDQVAC